MGGVRGSREEPRKPREWVEGNLGSVPAVSAPVLSKLQNAVTAR